MGFWPIRAHSGSFLYCKVKWPLVCSILLTPQGCQWLFLVGWKIIQVLREKRGTFNNWRGVWNKALSDFWCNVKFSKSFATVYKEIWKENLVIYQKSLKAFPQAPLQLLIQLLTLNVGFIMVIELSGVQFVCVILQVQVQFGNNLHQWGFAKSIKIAWAHRANAIWAFRKPYECKLFPNWTRKVVWLPLIFS